MIVNGFCRCFAAAGLLLGLGACGGNEEAVEADDQESTQTDGDARLYVWLYDEDGIDPNFLAVVDAEPTSEDYGKLLTTVPAGEVRGGAHHTSLVMPTSGILFANDFPGNHSFIFDTQAPGGPTLTGSFGAIGEYAFAHSFAELPNGNILATYQSKGDQNLIPGGLVELSLDGNVVQTGDADPGDPDIYVRPYGLILLPDVDRAVVTTFDMEGLGLARHIQIWRLSDLSLMQTLLVPPSPSRATNVDPFEGRVLADGETIMFETLSCGFYLLTGVGEDAPVIEFVHDFQSEFCGVPVRIGNFWVQPLEAETEGGDNGIVVLDISDPRAPVEVDRISFDGSYGPHWSSHNEAGTRIVINGYYENLARRTMMLIFDPETGQIEIDQAFGEGDEFGPGLMIDRDVWPHGSTGTAVAHGAVFWPPAKPDWKN